MTFRIPRRTLHTLTRRRFLSTAAATGISTIAMPYLSRAADRPVVTHGVQSGDVGTDGGVVWARSDRPAQMLVEVSTTESFKSVRKLPPIAALPESDFTAKMLVDNLPGGQDIFYRVKFRDLAHTDVESEPVAGRFRTAPTDRRDVSFVWGGDVAGQGWGINPDDGGMFTFSAMRKQRPDFFLHSGDTIYADGVIAAEVKLSDGKVWKNVTIPEKAKVAETHAVENILARRQILDQNLGREIAFGQGCDRRQGAGVLEGVAGCDVDQHLRWTVAARPDDAAVHRYVTGLNAMRDDGPVGRTREIWHADRAERAGARGEKLASGESDLHCDDSSGGAGAAIAADRNPMLVRQCDAAITKVRRCPRHGTACRSAEDSEAG